MSMVTATQSMTADEFFEWANLPENDGTLYELEAGRPTAMSSPGKQPGTICWLVVKKLTEYLTIRGEGYICTNDTGLIVTRSPDTVRGPDLMLFLEHTALDQITPKHAEDIPTLVVEVLSPRDSMGATLRRVEQYLALGVPLVWVVEPKVRAVQVYRPQEFPKVLDEMDELSGNGILPEFRCSVSTFFTIPKRT